MTAQPTRSSSAVTIPGVLARAARAWARVPRLAAASLLSLLVQQAFGTGFALAGKSIVDGVVTGHPSPPLWVVVVALGGAFPLVAVATLAGERVNAIAAATIVSDVRRRLYDKLQRLDGAAFVTTSTGSILARFGNNVKALEAGYTKAFLNTALTGISVLVKLPIMVLLDWRLAALTAALLPLPFLLAKRFVPRSVDGAQELRRAETAIVNTVQETVRAHQVVKTFGLERVLGERFDGQLAEAQQRSVRARVALATAGKTTSLTTLLVQVVVTLVGAGLASSGSLGAGSLIAFVAMLVSLTKDVYEYTKGDIPVLAEAVGAVGAIEAFLAQPLAVAEAPGAVPLPPLRHAISFEDVTFGYDAGEDTLRELRLEIPAGSAVAFVGGSGSGKSTAVGLVMRLHDPRAGRVAIDGRDLRDGTLASLRGQLAAVFQDTFLFSTTVGENIRLGRPGATDAEVEAAARAAEIHELVAALPQGYATPVGEAGGRLSGGQRQRLAIARALVRDPRILVLDEATSALDPATEAAVNATLERLRGGRTVISVTHRLASARTADRIFVLDEGRLAEQGTHDELVAAGGRYAGLWAKQSGFELGSRGRHARVEPGRLRQVALFSGLDDDALGELAPQLDSEYHEAHQTVFERGDDGDRFYLIARGTVEVLAPDGHVLAQLEDGDYFGEIALLRDRPRTATIRTVTPCTFPTLDREQLHELVAARPQLGPLLEEGMARSEARSDAAAWRAGAAAGAGA